MAFTTAEDVQVSIASAGKVLITLTLPEGSDCKIELPAQRAHDLAVELLRLAYAQGAQ